MITIRETPTSPLMEVASLLVFADGRSVPAASKLPQPLVGSEPTPPSSQEVTSDLVVLDGSDANGDLSDVKGNAAEEVAVFSAEAVLKTFGRLGNSVRRRSRLRVLSSILAPGLTCLLLQDCACNEGRSPLNPRKLPHRQRWGGRLRFLVRAEACAVAA